MKAVISDEAASAMDTLLANHKALANRGITIYEDDEDLTYEIYVVTDRKYRAAFKAMFEALPDD